MNEDRKAALKQIADELTEIYDNLKTLHDAEEACPDWSENAVGRIYFACENVFSAITSLDDIGE